MFCRNCGKKITDDSTSYCPDCGFSIKSEKKEIKTGEKTLLIVVVLMFTLIIIFLIRNKTTPKIESTETLDTQQPSPELITQDSVEMQDHSPKTPGTLQHSTKLEDSSPKSKLYDNIANALKGSVYHIEIKNAVDNDGYTVEVSVMSDIMSGGEALNLFASFFSVCYRDRSDKIEFASIVYTNSKREKLGEAGIGSRVAYELPESTWKGMSGMGSFLKRWILERANASPPGPSEACFYREY